MIKAEIVADSLSPQGNRLTSLVVTMPRMVLAEFNTHRMLSRNSASSRAIPFRRMVEMVKTNPFIPIAWQKEHTGMQGTEYITDEGELHWIKETHLTARDYAVQQATIQTERYGVTKQLVNRLLEPFMWHTVLVTASEWENFFHLRCPDYPVAGSVNKKYRSWKDVCTDYPNIKSDADILTRLRFNKGQAEIHMALTAEAIWDTMNESIPMQLQAGDWHIPFGDSIDTNQIDINMFDAGFDFTATKIKIATARCARVSYTTVGEEGKPDNYENDIKLHDRLLSSGHFSPFEHCATAEDNSNMYANFKGFQSYRNKIGA